MDIEKDKSEKREVVEDGTNLYGSMMETLKLQLLKGFVQRARQ